MPVWAWLLVVAGVLLAGLWLGGTIAVLWLAVKWWRST
jgi:hypothetical protein